MSDKQDPNVRTIHPRALESLGYATCVALLGVARDLRSGAIPPEKYDQGDWGVFDEHEAYKCGSPCCIAGHLAQRLGVFVGDLLGRIRKDPAVSDYYGDDSLFDADHPSDPQLAADAIERYVYEGASQPWRACTNS